MRFRLPQAALILALIALFLLENRAAYQGYFSDDDLDNLVSNLLPGFDIFWKGLVSFTYDYYNFRPVGHVMYRWMGQTFGLWFVPYVVLSQVLHLLNSLLVYMVARSTIGARPALIATVFFCFHPALFAAHWKPMYVFDLLCGLALLSAYFFYRKGSWIVSLLLFWCAYKAKEIAILFPLILFMEESWGSRQWLRLLPFFAVSLNFGLQALLANHGRAESAYTLRFTAAAIWECVRYYARASLGVPWVLLAGWTYVAQRRWLLQSALAAAVLMGPLLVLPGRLFAIYLYVPLLFGSLAVGAALSQARLPLLLALLLAYAGFGLVELKAFRKAELSQAQITQIFVESACAELKDKPRLTQATYENGPPGLNLWGVEAAIRLCSGNLALRLRRWESPNIQRGEALIRWVQQPGSAGRVEVTRFDGELDGTWHSWEGFYRWMGASGTARVQTAAGDRRLALEVESVPADELEVFVNGQVIGKQTINDHGAQRFSFNLPVAATGAPISVTLRVSPIRSVPGDSRELGMAVGSISTTP